MKHLITSLVVVCGMLFPACLIAQDSLAVVSDTLIVVGQRDRPVESAHVESP